MQHRRWRCRSSVGCCALSYTLCYLAATLLAMYFIGAAGLWCSVRASNSWKALLQTMGVGYIGGLVAYVVVSPVLLAFGAILLILLLVMDAFLNTRFASAAGAYGRTLYFGSPFALALLFLLLARWFLSGVQRWIADRERTRFWADAPFSRRSHRSLDNDVQDRRPARREE